MLKKTTALGAMLVVLSLNPGSLTNASAAESTLLKPGTTAPSFMLPNLENTRMSMRVWCGDTLSSPYTNKVSHTIILSFWATYCKPCMKEMPQLIAFAQKHKDDPVKVWPVSIDKEGASLVAPFIKEKGWDLQFLLDPYSKTSERYGVKSIPALFVINPHGVIQFSAQGFEEGTDLVAKLDGILADIAAGKGPAGKVLVGGESVAAQAAPVPAPATAESVSPQQRWHAVARVESGAKLEDVARELNVAPETIKAWYEELKKAAMDVWGKKP